MSPQKRLVFRMLPVLAGITGILNPFSSSDALELRAGAASAVISPPPGTFIAGDARNRRFAGLHDDLFAKAVVLSNGDESLAIIVIDCIGMVYPDIQAIRRAAASRVSDISLSPERIIVTSTHTHCGPDVVGLWGPDETTSGRSPKYMGTLTELAAAQVALAAQRLVPVSLHAGSQQSPMDWVENICEPGLLDPTLSVLQLVGPGDTAVATLVNFACHPTVMDGVTDQVSSDYVAGYYRAMKEAVPGEHLFLQGAIGGWVQPKKEGRSFELADRYGVSVAAAVIALLKNVEKNDDSTIDFACKSIKLPLENEGFQALASIGVIDRGANGTIESEVAWFRIGPVQFATHPGETSPQYSLDTRARMGGGPTFVLGLALDALGYILKPSYFELPEIKYAEYLTSMSVGPRTGPLVMEALDSIIPASPNVEVRR